ncbi:unnamed protein product [Mytilus coruscus]|uniref:Farnesoic acid O-methyl transferase domain-containing protein n=1 Tax=Mytilus coruscus TaxID=42192 RepID=A0A6J8A283_MYTCO|nr:unnamed protein product [Mytilus coruscus]
MILAVALLQTCLSAVFIDIALPKRFVTIDTEEKSLGEEITFHPDVNYLQFDVKGQRDAFLQFDFTFLIILGGWGNTKSTLSVGDKILDENHGPVLDHNNYNSFWISWNRSHIYFGQGINSGDNILMFGTSDCFPGVVDIILRSKFRQTVNWIINKADKGIYTK